MSVRSLMMMLYCFVVLVLMIDPSRAQSFVDLKNSSGEVNQGDNQIGEFTLSHPRSVRFGIESFNSVLTSEVNDMFGIRHLSYIEANKMWFNAIDYEWGRMKHQRRLEGETAAALSPYLVCDVAFGKLGKECHDLIKQHFGGDLVTIYNDYDKSCYIASATSDVAESAPKSLVVTPLLPEGKIREGVVDDIDFTDPMPHAFHALFCPGIAYNAEEAEQLAQSILADLLNEADSRRFLVEGEGLQLHVSHAFLRTDSDVATRHSDRQEFWMRNLQSGIESGACKDMYQLLEIEVSDGSAGFTVSLSEEDQGWGIRECLHSLVAGLSISDSICSVESRLDMTALNAQARWVTQTNVRDSTPFFDVGLSGEGQVVQVSDTGIDADNCYFNDSSGNIVRDGRTDLNKRKIVQYVSWANSFDTTRGHGTHVAGSVAGKRENGDGIVDGMAPAAKIAFFDIGFSGASSLSIPNNPTTLFRPGQDATAKIHSASWGGTGNSYGFGERFYDSFMEFNDDFLFIVAAGNDGERGGGSVGSPSVCKNGISVGATQNAEPHLLPDQLGQEYLASFSSIGPTSDGRAKPDLVAPGMYIRSAEARSDFVGECDSTSPDALLFNAGTSMSTPIVSGTAALVRQYFEDAWYPGGNPGSGVTMNPSSALVKAVLMNGAQAITGTQRRDGTTSSSSEYDAGQRFGRINLINSLPLNGKNSIKALIMDRVPISNNEVDEYNIVISGAGGCQEPLSAMLVWTDPANSPGCARCLINDLDLEVEGPDGIVYYPNGRTSADTVNNAERVRINAPNNNDVFTVRVRGANLDRSSQAYALVITGCFDEDGDAVSPVSSAPVNPLPTTPAPVPTVSATASPTTPIVTPNVCIDGNNGFFVDDVLGDQDCIWLETNKDTYPWLCTFTDISVECPVTCNVCNLLDQPNTEQLGDSQNFGVYPNGDTNWDGNMFKLEVINDLVVTGMFLHIRVNAIRRVQIYIKDGTFEGSAFNANTWGNPYLDVEVFGQGYGSLTTIGSDVFGSLALSAGETKSVYITLVGEGNDLVMTETADFNGVLVLNPDLRIREGIAITYPFGGTTQESFQPYGINGGFRYAVNEGGEGCTDSVDKFFISALVGDQDCTWVGANTRRFDYICTFINVAASCPQTCNFCNTLDGR